MALAIHLSIAFSNQVERLKLLLCILIIFLMAHRILNYCWSRGRIRSRIKYPCFINLLIQNVYLMPGLFYNFNEFCSVQRLNQIEHLSLTDNFWKKIDKELLRDVVVSIFTKTKIRGVNIFLERDVVCQDISYEGIIQDSRYFKIIGSNYQILQTRPARIGKKYGVK